MTKKILVADDSLTIRKIVAMAFENEDAIVEGVGDGKQAFDRLVEFQPDIVLADIDMPGLTGFELSKKIKTSDKFSSTCVLLLASDFEDFDESQFKDSGADDHISKPFKSYDVVQKVKSLLSAEGGKSAQVSAKNTEAQVDAAFELSVADMMVEAPETPEDSTFTLSPENLVENEEAPQDNIIELSEDSLEQPETAFELSTENLVEDESPDTEAPQENILELSEDSLEQPETVFELSEENITEDALPESVETPTPISDDELDEEPTLPTVTEASVVESVHAKQEEPVPEMPRVAPEETVLDEVINHVEALKQKIQPQAVGTTAPELDSDDSLAEIGATIDENMEEIEMEFQGIVKSIAAPTGEVSKAQPKASPDFSHAEDILPEPEDLLEKMAPSAFARKTGSLRPDLIGESFSYLSESVPIRTAPVKPLASEAPQRTHNTGDERFVQIVGEHVKKLLEKSLQTSIEKEISELGKTIQQTIRDVVKEVTPQIARAVIQEEIDKLRKQ